MPISVKYRKQTSGYLGRGTRESEGEWVKKGHEETLGGGGCIRFLDCEDAFINVCIMSDSFNCPF